MRHVAPTTASSVVQVGSDRSPFLKADLKHRALSGQLRLEGLAKKFRQALFMIKISRWLAISALLTILTIIGHEVAHYCGAVAVGAENLHLHWADVSFDEASLSDNGTVITWLAGPVFTHGIILWVLLSRTSNIWLLALGIGASSRNVVLIPFTLKLILEQDVSTFTNDEITAAHAFGIPPIFFALIAATLGIVGTLIFMRRAHRAMPYALPISLFVGTVLGIVIWGVVGPVVLPGGKGIA